MAKKVTIVIPGRPITKKNSERHFGKNHLPSEKFCEYQNKFLLRAHQTPALRNVHFSVPVKVKCLYYMPNRQSWPDLVGLLQATSDILEKAKILKDDCLIVSYDGSKIAGIDEFQPRAEITIEVLPEDDISYRFDKRVARWQKEVKTAALF